MKFRSRPAAAGALLLAGAALGAAGLATPTAAAVPISAVSSSAPASFLVVLPLRNKAGLHALLKAQQTRGSTSYRKWLTPAQAAAQFGPTAADMAAAKASFTAMGLTVSQTAAFTFKVGGTVAQVDKALGVRLGGTPTSGGKTRLVALTRPVLPAKAAAVGAMVPTFAPVADKKPFSLKIGPAPANINGPAGSYNFDDLKQAYDYPAYNTFLPDGRRLDGTGVRVGIIMANAAQQSDVDAEFNHDGWSTLTGTNPPTFNIINIDGGSPYGGPQGGTDEAELDVQQVLGGAPGASVTQLSVPGLDNGSLFDAMTYTIGLDCTQGPDCVFLPTVPFDIVSNSYGGCESIYLPDYENGFDLTYILGEYDDYISYAASEGVTYVYSSGDEAGLECPANSYLFGNPSARFVASVSEPADDPYVVAVGGGNLITAYTPGDFDSTYVAENGYGDPEIPHDPYGLGHNVSGGYWGAGGGLSQVWGQPFYQNSAFLSEFGYGGSSYTGSDVLRTLPDIGMQVGGCPAGVSVTTVDCPNVQGAPHPTRSAVVVTIGGGRYSFIGTSVSAPEFAGALALLEESLSTDGVPGSGALGANVDPILYILGATQIANGGAAAPSPYQYYHMNIPGYNGVVSITSGQGYNYVYGNGSPDVRNLWSGAYQLVTDLSADPFSASTPAPTPRTGNNP